MKYFKFIYPRFALIKAKDDINAIEIYNDEVMSVRLGVKIEEVTKEYVWKKCRENSNCIEINTEDFWDDRLELLLIDGILM